MFNISEIVDRAIIIIDSNELYIIIVLIITEGWDDLSIYALRKR